MSMHGAPLPPRSCLDRGTRSPTNDSEVNAMRAAAWHRHGVAALPVADIADEANQLVAILTTIVKKTKRPDTDRD